MNIKQEALKLGISRYCYYRLLKKLGRAPTAKDVSEIKLGRPKKGGKA